MSALSDDQVLDVVPLDRGDVGHARAGTSGAVAERTPEVGIPLVGAGAEGASLATRGFLRLRNIGKCFAGGVGEVKPAVHVERLDLPLGGIVAIVGGSGSGKTTLLNLLGGLETHDRPDGAAPEAREPVFDLRLPGERTTRRLGEAGAVALRYPRHRVSYVFQQGYLLSQASIGLNLEITRRAAGLDVDERALRELVSIARLAGDGHGEGKRLSERAVTLSGGQQQRLNIARALGRDPAILFADELSSSLDPRTAADVMTALRRWVRGDGDPAGAHEERTEGSIERTRWSRTMLWVTHDYPLACRFADALIVLAPGGPMPGLERPIELGTRAVTPAEIESWLAAGRIPPESLPTGRFHLPERADDGDVVAPPGSRARDLRPSLANMLAGVRLSWMEAFREPPARGGGALARLVRLPLGFAHRVRALQLAAVLALILIVTYGQEEVIGFFDAALDDPALRHVIVQQNVRELDRSVIDASSLAALSAEIDAGEASADASRWGFGRFTESVDVYPAGVDSIAPGFIAEATIGVLERHEPVYAELAVVPLGEGLPGCEGAAPVSPASLIPYADELALVVSRRYVDDAARMYGVDLCAEPAVDLWDAGAPLTFRIVGVAERLPADGYDRFDAVMQADVWRNWVSRVGKPALGSYSRAAVYFDRQNHARVIDALRARAFAFDEEIVSKFERLLGTAASLRNTFVAITWLSLAVAITVAAGLIWSYLTQNAKAIALLRAHDAATAPLVAAIPFQLTLTFLYSLGALGLLALLWNGLAASDTLARAIAEASGGAFVPRPVPWQTLAGAATPLAITYATMLLVGLLSLYVWHRTHPDLAHELRETE